MSWLDVGSVKALLQGAAAARRGLRVYHGAAHACSPRRAVLAAALVAGASCASPTPGAPAPAANAATRARAVLEPSAPLPARAEVVALADAVAVAAAKAPPGEGSASLARLAAELRERSWRLDHAEADAREALELYRAAARSLGVGEAACDAERRRALLALELAGDARAGYREVYLASRRQSAALLRGAKPVVARATDSPCLVALELGLARAAAYRPDTEALRALDREAESAADGVATAASTAASASAEPSASSASSASSTASTSDARDPAERDVVRSKQVASGPVQITGIEKYATDAGARVVIKLSGPTTYDVGTLEAEPAAKLDPRIYLDVARATAKGVPVETSVGGAVKRVRLGAQKDSTRIVLDLAQTLRKRVFYLPEPFRIVVDVSTRELAPASTSQKPGPREVKRVAIDAGHGGQDDGAVGPTGLKEKDVALDVAHRLAPILSHELKVETLLTRDNDTFVPLDLRTARANAFHADVFVSVHCNASENGTAKGVQSYVLDPSRAAESGAARLAARENELVRKSLDAEALDAEVSLILSNLQVAELSPRSQRLAELLQKSALASLTPRYAGAKDGGVKTAGFFVLAGADMPAVLFETSFISNPAEERRLGTADYRQKLADSIANAIRAYRDGK